MNKPTPADIYYRTGTLRKHSSEPVPTEPISYIDDLAYYAGVIIGVVFWVCMIYLMVRNLA